MSTTMKHDGGAAFPVSYGPDGAPEYSPGMTLRDWFAGQALTGWIAGIAGDPAMDEYEGEPEAFAGHMRAVAQTCYGYADAMLAGTRGGGIVSTLDHTADNCVGVWRLVGTGEARTIRCERCEARHPVTPENKLAAIDENYAGIYLRRLADEGASILDVQRRQS